MAVVTCSEATMMDRRSGDQASFFYEFRLDDRIPKDHLLRRIDLFVTPVLGEVRQAQARFRDDNRFLMAASGISCRVLHVSAAMKTDELHAGFW